MLFRYCSYDLATLRDIFAAQFGPDTKSPRYRAAQRRFTESMAGYSLVCYFLQIKVRTERRLASLFSARLAND
jgi:phosphatidylinositol kinase/protein kinase (PI-3  family)